MFNRTAILVLFFSLLLSGCVIQPVVRPNAAPAQAASQPEATATIAPTATVEPQASQPKKEITSKRCGDPAQLSEQLNFYIWTDYIDEQILTEFEEECGVKVAMTNYTSNEEALASIEAGNSGTDLYIPSDYAVQIAIEKGVLAPLDLSLIPNAANLSKTTMGMYYDRKNKYSLPYQWGTTGLAYNISAFSEGPPTSWAAIFEPEQLCRFKGQVTMLDDEREAPGAALAYLGYPWSSTDPAAHEAVRTLMLNQKECLAGYDSEAHFERLATSELVMAEIWSFSAALAYQENPNIRYLIPKEGGILWQDNMVIPKDAPHPYTAHIFINYLLEPEIGAKLTEYTFAYTPNQAADALLSQEYHEMLQRSGLFVDEATRNRLQLSIKRKEDTIFAETWAIITAE